MMSGKVYYSSLRFGLEMIQQKSNDAAPLFSTDLHIITLNIIRMISRNYETQIYGHFNEKFEDYEEALKISAITLSKMVYTNKM